MGFFHIFKIVQMVSNRATHHIYITWAFSVEITRKQQKDTSEASPKTFESSRRTSLR